VTLADLPVLPRQSGCYLWHAAGDRVIYVGKAIDLRSRVRSYFGRPPAQKAQLIVRDALAVEYIVTRARSRR
jgi:excinuclease ABC subunit C